jgi:hypothetical protein
MTIAECAASSSSFVSMDFDGVRAGSGCCWASKFPPWTPGVALLATGARLDWRRILDSHISCKRTRRARQQRAVNGLRAFCRAWVLMGI